MKFIIGIIVTLLCWVMPFGAHAQDKNETLTYEAFFDAKKMTVDNGYFPIYKSDDSYYIEIQSQDLGKDIFISTQVVKGYSSDISPQSGIYQFKKGRKNTVELFQNKSSTFAADSADFCMTQAIRNSGLIPVYKTFPIAATGKDGQSMIIDLTSELNMPNGIFDMSKFASMNNPDASRSGVEGYRLIDKGVVFTARRTQSQFMPGEGSDVNQISTFLIEMLIQRVPDHLVSLKKNNPAYGFECIDRVEYDSHSYRANTVNYIKRWNLEASSKNRKLQSKGVAVEPTSPILVWIDPTTPAPFVESIKQSLKQWETAFEKAHWKNVFKFVNDGSLAYKKLVFYWGNSYGGNFNSLVEDPVTGEILSARINLMDESAKDQAMNYFLWCGLTDQRTQANLQPIELRQEIFTSHLAGNIGKVLGLKENYTAVTAFSPEQLRNSEWLKQWGPSASVVRAQIVDYLVQPGDQIDPHLLLPKVSIYDFEAIDFAYGSRQLSPSLKETYYAENDPLDPKSQPMFLSNNLLKASELGIKNLKQLYPQIPQIAKNWPTYQNSPEQVSDLLRHTYSIYQFYVTQIAVLVGGRSKRTVIRGENELPTIYVSKEQQKEALAALTQYGFSGSPAWFRNEAINKIYPVDQNKFAVDMADGLIKNLLRKRVLESLVENENANGDKALTCHDLFDYFDQVIFNNYKFNTQFTLVQQSIQLQFVTNLLQCANENNTTQGLSDVSAYVQMYLIKVRDNLKKGVSSNQLKPDLQSSWEFMLLRMDREFFNKTI